MYSWQRKRQQPKLSTQNEAEKRRAHASIISSSVPRSAAAPVRRLSTSAPLLKAATMVKEIASKAEFEGATKETPVVIIDFYAVWCGPCRMIAPVMEQFEQELQESNAGKATFFKVDVDQHQELAMEMGINAMPTFHVYHNGELSKTIVGADMNKVRETVEALIAAL